MVMVCSALPVCVSACVRTAVCVCPGAGAFSVPVVGMAASTNAATSAASEGGVAEVGLTGEWAESGEGPGTGGPSSSTRASGFGTLSVCQKQTGMTINRQTRMVASVRFASVWLRSSVWPDSVPGFWSWVLWG